MQAHGELHESLLKAKSCWVHSAYPEACYGKKDKESEVCGMQRWVCGWNSERMHFWSVGCFCQPAIRWCYVSSTKMISINIANYTGRVCWKSSKLTMWTTLTYDLKIRLYLTPVHAFRHYRCDIILYLHYFFIIFFLQNISLNWQILPNPYVSINDVKTCTIMPLTYSILSQAAGPQ